MDESRLKSTSPRSLKRERDEELDTESSGGIQRTCGLNYSLPLGPEDKDAARRDNMTLVLTTNDANCRDSTPARSTTGSLTELGTSTPHTLSKSPTMAFAHLNGVVQPPKKKAKLTYAEKEEQRILKDIRHQERTEGRAVREKDKAEERAQKEAERKAREFEKARKAAEKEVYRLRKDAEKEEKRQIKELKDKERQVRDDEKRRKEDEKQKLEEEKRKKERTQPKLNSFFKKSNAVIKNEAATITPSPAPGLSTEPQPNLTTRSPGKDSTASEYEKRFPPFFIQNNVKVAPITCFERDEHASVLLRNALDNYISGERSPGKRRFFDAATLFNSSNLKPKVRGRKIVPMRDIMSEILGGSRRPIDLTTDSQNNQIKNTRSLLKRVPYKILSFAEDVRPPYKGTFTSQPKSGAQRLARNPMRRDLPQVDYNYDSEAEWEAEDGEDIESEGDDDEDKDIGDGEEDLEEFLDDADAETVNARKLVMQGDLEPKCTGLCWENSERRGPNVKMYRFLMEAINNDVAKGNPIDPFSTHYWDPPIATGTMEPPRVPLNTMKSTNSGLNIPNSKPMKIFGTPAVTKTANQSGITGQPPKKLVSNEEMPAFRQAIDGNELSKIGLIEVLNKQFPKIAKSTIKSTLEVIAKRVGSKEAEKRWVLIEDGRR